MGVIWVKLTMKKNMSMRRFSAVALVGLTIVFTTGCSMIQGFLGGGTSKTESLNQQGQLMGVPDREGWIQDIPMGMVPIRGGTFFMGQADEDVAATQINFNRQVTIDAFLMDAEEITNNEYRQFLQAIQDTASQNYLNFVQPDTTVWSTDFAYHMGDKMMRYYFIHQAFDNYPVVGVSWDATQEFANWRTQWFNTGLQNSARDSLPPEALMPNFRLPTEAEWEYSARGGRDIVKYPWGGPYVTNKSGCLLANFKPGRGNYINDGYPYTAPVNSFLPNPFNLYNMSGNVAEWCQDDFTPVYNALVWDLNPVFIENDPNSPHYEKKVVRGGSWKDISYYLQTGTRTFEYKEVKSSYIGFRCAMDYLGSGSQGFSY